MSKFDRQVSRETPAKVADVDPIQFVKDQEATKPEKYLVKTRHVWMRNGVTVHMDAGSILLRSKQGQLIDEALKQGANVVPVMDDQLYECPHCRKISALVRE